MEGWTPVCCTSVFMYLYIFKSCRGPFPDTRYTHSWRLCLQTWQETTRTRVKVAEAELHPGKFIKVSGHIP